jgi:integrase
LSKHDVTEAEAVDKAKDRGGKPELLKPEQMAELMAKAEGKIALYLAIAGFAGIRAAEIMRLEWKDFNFARGHITVAADKAKTATRRLVPILPNLAEYLRPYRGVTGALFKMKDDERAINFAKQSGIDPWPNNCLRHSYASYRLAATQDAQRVALEMGNSPNILIVNYRELADEHDAKAWFAIAPKRAKNVVSMSAA